MEKEYRRTFERRPCRGEVFIYNLSGGPAVKAHLIDLGKGGASIALDRHLPPGMTVRLVFPRKNGDTNRSGRVIVGHIVHSRAEAGRHVIGVVFGWHAAVKDGPQPLYRKTSQKWFGLFSRKPRLAPLALSREALTLERASQVAASLGLNRTASIKRQSQSLAGQRLGEAPR